MITPQFRDGLQTPNAVTDNGCVVSNPIYISPTTLDRKALLNTFREIKRQQLLEMVHSDKPVSKSGVQVIDNTKAPLAPIELEVVPEEQLRLLLFSRGGIAEKFLLKLQKAVGLEVVTREDLIAAATEWINHLTHEPKRTRAKKAATAKPKAAC